MPTRCSSAASAAAHLISKHRFIAAQLDAYLADDLWLTLARHANRMADALATRLAMAGAEPVWPVEANEVFVILPRAADERLKAAERAITRGNSVRCRRVFSSPMTQC